MCLYVKARIFLSRIKERGHLILTYVCSVWVCVSSGMSKSLKPTVGMSKSLKRTVGVLMYLSTSDLFLRRASYSCHLCPSVCWLLLWTKKILSSYSLWGDRNHHHHHHHIALVAQITLTLSRHSSLSFIALGRSSGQHPVSSHSCWMYVRAGRPAFARPCVGIHKSTFLMSSSLF